MFCKNCASALKDEIGFCPFCGIRLSPESVSVKVPTNATDAACRANFCAKTAVPKTKLLKRVVWAFLLALIPMFGLGFALGVLCSTAVRENTHHRRVVLVAVILASIVTVVASVLLGYYIPTLLF